MTACVCGRRVRGDPPTPTCAPCAALEGYYTEVCEIFARFPNQCAIVQQLMRWPWTLHTALSRWADAVEEATEWQDATPPLTPIWSDLTDRTDEDRIETQADTGGHP